MALARDFQGAFRRESLLKVLLHLFDLTRVEGDVFQVISRIRVVNNDAVVAVPFQKVVKVVAVDFAAKKSARPSAPPDIRCRLLIVEMNYRRQRRHFLWPIDFVFRPVEFGFWLNRIHGPRRATGRRIGVVVSVVNLARLKTVALRDFSVCFEMGRSTFQARQTVAKVEKGIVAHMPAGRKRERVFDVQSVLLGGSVRLGIFFVGGEVKSTTIEPVIGLADAVRVERIKVPRLGPVPPHQRRGGITGETAKRFGERRHHYVVVVVVVVLVVVVVQSVLLISASGIVGELDDGIFSPNACRPYARSMQKTNWQEVREFVNTS